MSTEKKEGKKFEFKGSFDDSLKQSAFVNAVTRKEEDRLPSLLKKAKQWATKSPDYPQISRQKRKIELAKKLLRKENGLNEWIERKAIAYHDNPFSYRMSFTFPSIEKEETILSAMMGDGGKKIKEKYPIFTQEMKNISESIRSEGRKAWEEADNSFWDDFPSLRNKMGVGIKSVFGVKLTGDRDKDFPLVKSAYRKAAKETHPDTGGSDADFRKINDEWERYLKTLPANYSEAYLLWI